MSDRSQSEFNMAVSYLNRLNALFYMADDAAIELDVYNWSHTLMAIFRELSTEMKEEEVQRFNEEAHSIQDEVSRKIGNYNRTGTNKGIEPELYKKIHNFELKLRRILKEAGLQNKMLDDAGAALK